ncbi:MAG: hypothetical protein U0Z17_08550 [Bacteroidales bacterium]
MQKVPQVGSLPDPEFSLGVFLSPMELLGGNQVADMRLMQMFPWFGFVKSMRTEMSLMAAAKFELVRDAKLQLFFDMQRNWFEMHKVKQEIRIAEKNIEILQSLERLAIAPVLKLHRQQAQLQLQAATYHRRHLPVQPRQ